MTGKNEVTRGRRGMVVSCSLGEGRCISSREEAFCFSLKSLAEGAEFQISALLFVSVFLFFCLFL